MRKAWVVVLVVMYLVACKQDTKVISSKRATAPAFTVSLTADKTEGSAPLTVKFTATATGGIVWVWLFGDGTSAAHDQVITHTFTNPGDYDVIVATANMKGQGATAIITVHAVEGLDATNTYCGPGNIWTGPKTDGVAEAPHVCYYTALNATPSPGPVKTVASNEKLTDALKTAACGDTYKVVPENITASSIALPTLPACDAQHYITIETSAIDKLPDEKTRISPAFAGTASLLGRPPYIQPEGGAQRLMPRIILTGSQNISGCRFVRIIGFEITRTQGTGQVVALIAPGKGTTNCIFDRNWIHGTATDETRRGAAVSDTTNVAFINNYFSDFHCLASAGACTDAQAIANGVNTIDQANTKVVNNFLEASGEAFLSGGGPSFSIPTDMQFMYNDFFKPWQWDPLDPTYIPVNGHPWIVKNHFELKTGKRVWFEGNRLQNVWGGFSQVGASILITPKNQGNFQCPGCGVEDVVLRYNYVSYMSQAVQAACTASDAGAWPASCKNWNVHDNVYDNVQYGLARCYGCSQVASQLGSGYNPISPPQTVLSNASFTHNTVINSSWNDVNHGNYIGIMLGINGPPPNNSTGTPQMSNIVWSDNILATGWGGIYSNGGGVNNCATVVQPIDKFTRCWVGSSAMAGNLFVIAGYKGGTSWPTGNYFPTDWPGVGFKDFVGGDYTLAPTSPYVGKGTDGKDPGANITAVNASIARRH